MSRVTAGVIPDEVIDLLSSITKQSMPSAEPAVSGAEKGLEWQTPMMDYSAETSVLRRPAGLWRRVAMLGVILQPR